MVTTLTRKQLKRLVKESIKEVLDVELMKARASLLDFVSDKEQKDIEKRYKNPSHKVEKSYSVTI